MPIASGWPCGAVLALPLLVACSVPRETPPDLERAVWLVDGASGAGVAWDRMLGALAEQEVVFLGETHDDQVTHALELAVLQELDRRRDGKVVLALEMFERDRQAALDQYIAGRSSEAEFSAAAGLWKNYRAGYRPLIEYARERKLPVVAANARASTRRKVSSGGLAALTWPESKWVAAELLPNSDAYWERFDAVMVGHGGSGAPKPTAEERLRCGQSVWDNTMGESVARALEQHPGHTVLLVVGRFHVERMQGTAEQTSKRRPGTRAMSLIAEPVESLERADPRAVRGLGTFVAFAERRARILSDEEHALRLDGELRYALHVPAIAGERRLAMVPMSVVVPWLVWLPREGDRPADAMARLRGEMGDSAALVVVEGPLPLERADLARGAAWTSAGSREEQRERIVEALLDALRSLPRSYPLDPARLAIGGEGEGRAIAEDLRSRIANARPVESLRDARSALDLEPRGSQGEIALLLEDPAPPLARTWAESYAASRADGLDRAHRVVLHAELAALPAGTLVRPLTFAGAGYAEALRSIGPQLDVREAFGPQDLADGRALPLASGGFGGTTVLVVPGAPSDEQRAEWLALETEKAIAKRSSFAQLAVCFEAGNPSLAEALAKLVADGKRSALVVPAVFAAEVRAMHALREAAGDAAAKLEIEWLPGLGGEIGRVER